jgi:anti-anti-sigma factor
MASRIIFTSLHEPLTDITRAQLRGTVRREIARGNLVHVVDLSELSALDPSTLSEIIRMRRWLREVGGSLDLIVRHPNVYKILTVAGLDRLFGVYPSEGAALAALGTVAPIPA